MAAARAGPVGGQEVCPGLSVGAGAKDLDHVPLPFQAYQQGAGEEVERPCARLALHELT